MNKQYWVLAAIFGFGIFLGRVGSNHTQTNEAVKVLDSAVVWTCSMHPNVQQPHKGACPLCGMDLIPQKESSFASNRISMSDTAMKLAQVQTSLVRKGALHKELRVSGTVQIAESRRFVLSSHISGRVERLLVDFTGDVVRKGQIIAYVYSPDIVTAQEELLEAWKNRSQSPHFLSAAKAKLRNWKIEDAQIEEILRSGKVQEQVAIIADSGGTVLEKNITLGNHVNRGETMFVVADLSQMWVMFDIYEADLMWIREGDEVEFNIVSLPQQNFRGRVQFIDPIINPKTRTAQARVEIKNPEKLLKPSQFAQGTVLSTQASSAESLYVPKTAVLWTGKRSLVYVKNENEQGVSFEMKQIEVGALMGENWIVLDGLTEGQEIVSHGVFAIDSAAQLQGKQSMMNLAVEAKSNIVLREEEKRLFLSVLDSYLAYKDALVSDNFPAAQQAVQKLSQSVSAIDLSALSEKVRGSWFSIDKKLRTSLELSQQQTDLYGLRSEFKNLSGVLISMVLAFGSLRQPLYLEYCPMAENNTGGNWLSVEPNIQNPYFGASMLTCGEVQEEY